MSIKTRLDKLESMTAGDDTDKNIFFHGVGVGETPVGYECNGVKVYCLPGEAYGDTLKRLEALVKVPGRAVFFINNLSEVSV